MSEAAVQANVRLEASRRGWLLFRNNSGVLKDDRGIPVRFGLCNDTAALNKVCKSSDLIGWRTVQITPDMVGQKLAQFVAIECKTQGWKYTGTAREVAQKNFIDKVNVAGGYAAFIQGEL